MNRTIDLPFYDLDKAHILALLDYGEARGEPDEGKEAVMFVVRNRAIRGGWFLDGGILTVSPYHAVALKNTYVARKQRFIYQFSCFQENDPNRALLLKMAVNPNIDNLLRISLAQSIIDGNEIDPTKGATYYYSDSIAAPGWSRNFKETIVIGKQHFMTNVT